MLLIFVVATPFGNLVASRFCAGSSLMRLEFVLGGAKQIRVDQAVLGGAKQIRVNPNYFGLGQNRLEKALTVLGRAKQPRVDPNRFFLGGGPTCSNT